MAAPKDITYLFPLAPERATPGSVVFRHSTKVIGLIVATTPLPPNPHSGNPEVECHIVWQNGKSESDNSRHLSDFDAYCAYEERERFERLARRENLGRLGPLGPGVSP
jgi:hypothetical protein